MARGWRGRLPTDMHMRKKGKHRQKAGMMVSIYRKRANRRKKNEGKKKRGRKMEMLEGRDTMGSVFILVQVSLLIEVFIIWRCKAFLCCVENVNYPAENGVVFTLVLLADQLDIP